VPRWPLKLLYVHSDTPLYVRVSKNIPVFSRLFGEVHFVGASRGKVWTKDFESPNIHYHMWNRVLPHGARSAFSLPAYMRHLRRVCAEVQPDIVVATNEDFVLPFALGFIPAPRYIVCDLLDSLALRVTGRTRLFAPLWHTLGVLCKFRMDAMVEMTEERLSRHWIKPALTTVILNSPKWSSSVARWPDVPPNSVFLSGSLNDGIAGVETLLAALESTPAITAVVAGRLNGEWLNTVFRSHPQVRFLGEVSPLESLQIASACAAIFAFYRPITVNMRYAAPNKVFDAMMTGKPLLINSECAASRFATANGFGLTSPYDDSRALGELLRQVVQPSAELLRNCELARVRFSEEYSWDRMEDRWERLFENLLEPAARGRAVTR
jgi:glycosyltransferase involved in cell wall biosynthesis